MGETPMRLTGETPVLLAMALLAALVTAIPVGHSAVAQPLLAAPPDVVVVIPNPAVAQLEEEIRELDEARKEARDRLGENHRETQALTAKLVRLREQLASEPAETVGRKYHVEDEQVIVPNPKLLTLKADLKKAKDALENAKTAGMKDIHPDYQRIITMIARLERQIANTPAEVVGSRTVTDADGTKRTMVPNPNLPVLNENLTKYRDALKTAKIHGMKDAHPDVQRIQRMIAQLEQQIANEPAEVVVARTVIGADGTTRTIVPNPRLLELREDLERARDTLEMAQMASPQTVQMLGKNEKHPSIRQIREVISRLEDQIAHEPAEVEQRSVTDTPNPRRVALKQEWRDILTELGNREESIDHPNVRPLLERLVAIELELADEANSPTPIASDTQPTGGVVTVTWAELQRQGKLLSGEIQPAGAEGWQALRVGEGTYRQEGRTTRRRFPLAVLDDLNLTTGAFMVEGKVRFTTPDSRGYGVEMLVAFPDGVRYCVGTAPQQVKRSVESEEHVIDMSWRPFSLAFDATDVGRSLEHAKLEINLVMQGAGVVEISPLRVVNLPPGPPVRYFWWSSQAATWIAVLLAAGFMGLVALHMILVRKHAPYRVVLVVLAAELVLGLACLALGSVAVAQSQPIYITYPLFFIGGGAYVAPIAGWFNVRRHYREIELRKMRAMDMQ